MTSNTPTNIKLPDGRVVRINDYVYLTSPWNAGDAYLIGRVMEFIQLPERVVNYKTADAEVASSAGNGESLYARINTFLRPRDIGVRCPQDPRLLIGTMTADLYTIDSIRGLCTVAHRDWVTARPSSNAASTKKYSVESDPALLAWKEKEHHFFFYQLFERYANKLFDIIPVEQVTNAPAKVLDTLRARYSFVSTEAHGVAGLTNPVRTCDKCEQWIPTTDAVQCDACKKHWHLDCITPRLTFHPMKVRGYRWTCAPCNRIHEERVHNEMVSDTPIVNSGRSSRSRQSKPVVLYGSEQDKGASGLRQDPKRRQSQSRKGKKNDPTPVPSVLAPAQRELRTWEEFSLRYFGQNSSIDSVTDEMDWPYPVVDPRLGSRYQHTVPSWEEQMQWGIGEHEPDKDSYRSGSEERCGEAKSVRAASSSLPRSLRGSPMPSKRRSTPPSDDELRTNKRARTKAPADDSIELMPSGLPAAPSESPEVVHETYESVAQLLQEATEAITAGTDSEEEDTILVEPKARASSSKRSTMSKSPFPDSLSEDHTPFPARGGDDTVELIFSPTLGVPEKTVDAYLDKVRRHTESWKAGQYDVDVIDVALAQLAQHPDSPKKAFEQFCRLSPADFRIVNWSTKDKKTLEKEARTSLNLESLKKIFPHHSTGDLVRAFYLARNVKYQFVWSALRVGDSSIADIIDRPSILFRSLPITLSIYPTDANGKKCENCHTTRSSYWLKGPPFEGNPPLCAVCGLFWRCYASKPDPEEVAARRNVPSNFLLLKDNLGPMPYVLKSSPQGKVPRNSAGPKATSSVSNGDPGSGRTTRSSRSSPSPLDKIVPNVPDKTAMGGAYPVPWRPVPWTNI